MELRAAISIYVILQFKTNVIRNRRTRNGQRVKCSNLEHQDHVETRSHKRPKESTEKYGVDITALQEI
uniref:Uncharacterized protein n=1 Tax=Megaselia scalaris TaxID=36166 RepID=T1H1A4_MEGSC